MKNVDLLSIPVTTGSYSEFVNAILESALAQKSQYTCIANVHTLIEAYSDYSFATIVNSASFITPDGKPLAWALRALYGIRQVRVAGMDLLPDLLENASVQRIPVFFYGGTPDMMSKTREYLARNYPNLLIRGFYCPPFRSLTQVEEEAVIRDINDSGAKLVFVVLGCPKQEKWMSSMKGRVHAGTVGVGGALAVMIGDQKRAPVWMQNAGMEWVFRLAQEPARLFKRYAITNSLFILLFVREYVRIRILPKREPGKKMQNT